METLAQIAFATLMGLNRFAAHPANVPDKRRAPMCRLTVKPFEWGYWLRLASQEALTIQTAEKNTSILWAAFSPDGNRIVTANANFSEEKNPQNAEVWDAHTGRKLLTLKEHKSVIRSVAYTPDGKRIITGSWDNTVRIWDAITGKELHCFPCGRYGVFCLSVSPDGKWAAAGSDERESWHNEGWVTVWDLKQNRKAFTLKGHKEVVWSVAFSPDSKRVASLGRDWHVVIWDVATGKENLKIPVPRLSHIAFSPDGKQILTSGEKGTMQVCDAETGKERLLLVGFTDFVNDITFSPDGRWIATAEKTVKIWDAHTGKELLTLNGHPAGVVHIAFSPDGSRLLSVGWNGKVKVWILKSGKKP